MKNVLFVLLFLSGYLLKAQAYPTFDNNQELKFNIGLFLATTTVDASYEYYLSEDTSLGGTVYFDNDASDINGNFGIGPNFRVYFGYAPRSGFFAEAFGLYYTGEEDISTDNLGTRNNDYSTFALGLGLGINGSPEVKNLPWNLVVVLAEISIRHPSRTHLFIEQV